MRTVPFLDLKPSLDSVRAELDAAHARVLERGWLILGPEVEAFEAEFAAYAGAKYCIGVGNGLDALRLSLEAADIGPSDDVIVPSNTYIATWLAVSAVGAQPVPVEPVETTYNIDASRIEEAITGNTKAILPVHFYGQPADMDAILAIARERELKVIDDCAQAHGARYKGNRVGALCNASAWSFYPTKNLGALGDGGAVTTDDADLAERLRLLRNYGTVGHGSNTVRGWNSRLDELQAAFLRVNLGHLDDWNRRRSEIASTYIDALGDLPVTLPDVPEWAEPSWHLFVVRVQKRDKIQAHLAEQGIETLVHYPIAPHLQLAYADLALGPGSLPISERLHDEVLSLPIGAHMDDNQVLSVVEAFKAILQGD